MVKILIDTNKFLDFYRYKDENKEILDKLSLCNNIILTEQIIREFKRNRVAEIQRLLDSIESKKKSINDNFCYLNVVGILSDDIKEVNSENKNLMIKVQENFKQLENKVISMLDDENNDDVFNALKKIISNKKTTILNDNDEAYSLALKRNNLGGIPRSDKGGFKNLTICDEYIWECLLLKSRCDILFVTRDKTYIDNSKLLMEEYNKKTGKKIEFVELVSMALSQLGEKISDEAIEKEKQELSMINKLSNITGVDTDKIDYALLTLTAKEEKIIRLRFGLEDGICRTLDEVASMFGISRGNVIEIEARAMYKMRNRIIHENVNEEE